MSDTLDGPFTGLNLDAPGELLAPGQLQQADNVYLDSGDLVTRPGWEAMLSAPFGAGRRISAAFPIRYNGDNYALFAMYNGSTGDELWLWQESAPTVTPTKVSGAVLFTTGQVQFAQLRNYVFIAGAQDGKLYRFLVLGTSIEATTGLTTPTRSLQAGITFNVLSALTNAASWAIDQVGSPSLSITDADFTNRGTGSPVTAPSNYSTGWDVYSGTVESVAGSSLYASSNFIRLDEPNSGLTSKLIATAVYYTVPTKTNANGIGASARYPVHFDVGFVASQLNGNQSVVITLLAYTTVGNTLLGSITQTFTFDTINNYKQFHSLFSFAGIFPDTTPFKLQARIQAGPQNSPGSATGAYLSNFTLDAVCANSAPASIAVDTTTGIVQFGGIIGTPPLYLSDGTIPIGDIRFAYNLGSAGLLAGTSQLVIPWFDTFPTNNPYLVNLGLRKTPTGAALDIPLNRTEGSLGEVYYVADVTVIDQSYLTGSQYIELHFLTDNKFSPSQPFYANTGQAAFGVIGINEAGPLSVGANNYEYRYREWLATSSKASVPSNSITPLLYKRTGYVVVSGGVPENAGANTEWFRRGGTFGDGLWRRIAYFPSGSNYNATYFNWNASTRTLTDKTPDSQLLVASLLTDHDPAPFNASEMALAVGVHSARVAVATATALYLSQVPQSLYDAGMYWDLVTDPNAVDVDIRGLYTKLSGQQYIAGDTVQRLLPFRDDLIIFFRTSRFLLIGISPANYEIRRDETDRGKGLLAPGAVEVTNGIWFVSQDGLRFWDGAKDTRMSAGIEKAVYPAGLFSGLQPNYNFLEQARIAFSGGRFYLSIPFNFYETDCTALFVLDPRFDPPAWTRWTLPNGTGGRRGFGVLWAFGNTPKAQTMSTPSGNIQGVPTVTDALYVGTNDGQLFRLRQESGDILTAGGATSRTAVQVTGRKVIAAPNEWVRGERISVDITPDDPSPTATIEVIGTEGSYSLTYFLQTGQNTVRDVPVPSDVTGRALWWRVTNYGYYQTRLQQVGMVARAERAKR